MLMIAVINYNAVQHSAFNPLAVKVLIAIGSAAIVMLVLQFLLHKGE